MTNSAQESKAARVHLRNAHAGDIGEIEQIEKNSFDNPQELFHRRQIASLVANPRAIVLLAEDASGRPLGWGAALIRRHAAVMSGRVYAVAVHPHGRGQGVGKSLMVELIARLRREGTGRIFLEVRADNAAAIGLYRKLGFTKVRDIPDYYGPGLHALRMICAS